MNRMHSEQNMFMIWRYRHERRVGRLLAAEKRQEEKAEKTWQEHHARAVAVVTRRLQSLNVHGQQVETVGIPLHWGFEGVAQKGYIANTLTPNVGDSNSQTPEYKAFLVNIEKA